MEIDLKIREIVCGLCLIAGSPSLAQSPVGVFCNGTYNVVSGTVTGVTTGSRIDLVRTRNEGTAQLEMMSCTEASLTLQGRTVAMTRGANSPEWKASARGGGGTIYFTFTAPDPDEVYSRMSTSGDGLTVFRGSKFSMVKATSDPLLGCAYEPPQEPSQFDQIGSSFLAEEGQASVSGKTLRDYFVFDVIGTSDAAKGVPASFEMSIPLSLDGVALPRLDGDDELVATCSGRKLEPTRKNLMIKVYPVDPGYTAFARIVDVETSKIEVQAEGVADGQTAASAVDAMRKAYAGIGAPIKGMGHAFAN